MINNLAIVSGFGNLSQEVDALAGSLKCNCFRYTIKPWLELGLVWPLIENAAQASRAVALHPFQFSNIEIELRKANIDSVFLTGDFPKGRLLQARLSETWLRFFSVADTLCSRYFATTPSQLPQAIRYFLALEQLLFDLKVRPVLAHEVLPQLNLPHGSVSRLSIPSEILEQIPDIARRALDQLTEKPGNSRFPQSVIVDRNVVCAVETTGTDALLRKYASSEMARRKTFPFLLKLPSAAFNPALDQPTIGLNTISECKKAGVRGVIVCAETTVVGQNQAMIEMINRLEMFLYAIPFRQLRSIYLAHSPNSWAQNAPIGLPQL